MNFAEIKKKHSDMQVMDMVVTLEKFKRRS